MKLILRVLFIFFLAVPSAVATNQTDQKQLDVCTILMRSTYKIQGNKSLGTAFIMGEPSQDSPEKSYYVLITAAHVLDGMNSEVAVLHLRKQEGEHFSKLLFSIPIRKDGRPLWIKHPAVDIAAMRVRLPREADVPLISTNLIETDEILEQFQVHPGDQLLVLGFPYGAEANDAGFPILRSGRIASYPLVPGKVNKTFLLDFEVFKGNSGGPVLFYCENRVYGETTHIGSIQFVMGVVSQEKDVTERVESLSETVVRRHRLALGVITHASFVVDLLKMLPTSEKDIP